MLTGKTIDPAPLPTIGALSLAISLKSLNNSNCTSPVFRLEDMLFIV